MARNYLAISASSIPVERIFSGGTGLITSTRCSLSVDTIRYHIWLNYWWKGILKVNNAINSSTNIYSQNISATNKLLKILAQGKEKAYSLKEIVTNFTDLKSTLALWRQTNDGMYWARKTRKPDKREFGIIGLQVAGNLFHLNVLIMNVGNIHRYCSLQSAEIPVQLADKDIVIEFVKTLLILRNITIINMPQLSHAPISRSERWMEKSITVFQFSVPRF
ncbi:2351_t:CDS:2 [Entrophospora sp. SA101]|nr:2351_t:CDS:2 [Entrophospora sp. SA101]